jgi:GT2 family glycosyltransferase
MDSGQKLIRMVVGIPTKDQVFSEFALSLRLLRFPQNCQVLYALSKTVGIDVARNEIIEKAPADADYVLFLDSDVLVPPDAVLKLMSHGKDIVSGLYFSSNPPFYPHAYKSDGKGKYDHIFDYPKDSLLEVDAVGAGALLVRKAVFDKIGAPYFQHAVQKTDMGEDFYFCKKARESGFKVFCDTSVKCTHMGVSMIGENAWDSVKDEVKKRRDTKGD